MQEGAREYEGRPQPRNRDGFCHSRVSMGAAGSIGHWVKTLGILAPLVIGELVKDPDKRWRLIRVSAVATALVSEGLWANRIKRREQCGDEPEQVGR